MDIKKAFIRRAGMGILAAFVVLMSSAVSWGATNIFVYQDTDGSLTVKTMAPGGNISEIQVQTVAIPNSCVKPELSWDGDVGKLRLAGFDASGNPKWNGTIGVDGQFASIMTLPSPITCGTVAASVVSAMFPDAVPCTSYSTWSTCSGGVMTRTGSPTGCVADQPTILSCTQACTTWTYATSSSWTPADADCITVQTREVVGSPSPCVGFPTIPTVRACPPKACTDYLYSSWSTCTNNSQSRTVTGYTPTPCNGTPAASSVLTQTCSSTTACTGYQYSSWGTCTNNSQSRTVTGYTPLSCSGTPAASSVLTQTCSPTQPGVTTLTAQNTAVRLTLASHASSLFKFTAPAGGCTSGFKAIQVNLVTDSVTGGDGQVLVKSSNQLKASLPTVDDYTYEIGRVGYVPGVDWTRDPNGGVFFWTFTNGGAGENVTIKNAAAYGRAFNQADTYYVLLYNAGAVQNGYRISWKCF